MNIKIKYGLHLYKLTLLYIKEKYPSTLFRPQSNKDIQIKDTEADIKDVYNFDDIPDTNDEENHEEEKEK